MSEQRNTGSKVSFNRHFRIEPEVTFDPLASTPIATLLPGASNKQARRRLQALCDKHKKFPAYALVGLESAAVPFIGQRHYMALRNLFIDGTATLADKNLNAYKAFLLFGSVEKAHAFEKKWTTKNHAISFADLMKRIHFPPAVQWDKVNFRAWGALLHQYGPARVGIMFRAHGAKITPIKQDGTLSITRTKFNIAAYDYKTRIPERIQEQIDRLALLWDMNPNEYKRALVYYADRGTSPGQPHFLPTLFIDGARYGMPGTRFYALDRDDPIKLFIGNYTDCCEKVSDQKFNIEGTIAHSYRSPTSAFYVVADDEKIIAHSWAWLGTNNALCFDGFESEPGNGFTATVLERLMIETGLEICNKRYDDYALTGLYLGLSKSNLEPARQNFTFVDIDELKPLEISQYGMNKHGTAAVMAHIV